MNVSVNIDITKEDILAQITPEDIFKEYLEIEPEIPGRYTNPLRNDTNPDCYFKYDSRDVLKFVDLAKGWSWDCFNVVEFKYSCSFLQALRIIANDFGLSSISVSRRNNILKGTPKPKVKTVIKFRQRNFVKKDYDFWIYSGRDDLLEAGIYAVDTFWLCKGKKVIKYVCGTSIRTYAYVFGVDNDGDLIIKIYCPDKTIGRFYHTHSNILQGSNKLPRVGKNCLITKSYKDAYYSRRFGIPSIAPMSETILLTHNQYDILSSKFDNLYSLMDNDRAGLHMAWMLRTYYGIQPLLFPKDMKKDLYDNLLDIGYQGMIDLIEYINELE